MNWLVTRGQDNFGPSLYPSLTCVENDGSLEFRETPENVAFRSISRMQIGPDSGSPNSESGIADGEWRVASENRFEFRATWGSRTRDTWEDRRNGGGIRPRRQGPGTAGLPAVLSP